MTVEKQIEKALAEIRPVLRQDGGDLELVGIEGQTALVKLKGACHGCPSATATLRNVVEEKIKEHCPEITEVRDVSGPPPSQPPPARASSPYARKPLSGVAAIIAIASGKGGVGKSTVAVNLALALQQLGLQTGLLDADIYGPSVPMMLGTDELPKPHEDGVRPVSKYDVKVMSIGFYIDEKTPVIWRGPMVMKALNQLLSDVNWGKLDCLVVDLPPGTGDAQLTLMQAVPVTGAVVITTPSDVALIDARRAIAMFDKLEVPVVGVAENMSHFVCPHCQKETEVFSRGGGKKEAAAMKVSFLGEIPLDPAIGRGGDQGKPVMASTADGPQAQAFIAMAKKVSSFLEDTALIGRRPADHV